MTGGAGGDILIGSAGDDTFDGDQLVDTFIGFVADTDTVVPPNTPPTASVSASNTTSPRSNDQLTATVSVMDPDNNGVTMTYQWFVGANLVQTTNTTALIDTLDLSLAGHGDRGEMISLVVTPHDSSSDGNPVGALAIVVNAAPSASVSLDTTSPRTNGTLTATVTRADDDGDPVTLTYRWFVGTTLLKTTANVTTLTDTLDLSVAGNGDKGKPSASK